MNRINSLRVLLALLVAGVLAGCGGGNKYVGQWDTTMQGLPVVATFNADNTFNLVFDIPQAPGAKIKVLANYKEEGENLSITFNDVAFENLPTQAKAQEPMMKDMFMKQVGGAGRAETAPVKWEGDDKFTLTSKGTPQVFTRKK